MHKVIDDYLPSEQHISLKKLMESDNFPWFFNKGKVFETDKLFDYQFLHIFYKEDKINSNYFDLLNPLIKKLKPLSLIRVKANLYPNINKVVKHPKHVDYDFITKGALFYLNTNNGPTYVENKKIDSVKNRLLLFNASKQHNSTTCTDKKIRLNINVNYL